MGDDLVLVSIEIDTVGRFDCLVELAMGFEQLWIQELVRRFIEVGQGRAVIQPPCRKHRLTGIDDGPPSLIG